MTVSIVTTCKGRLSHLKQTIWSMAGQLIEGKPVDEVIVVDYGCPDGVSDWIESQRFPNVKAVKAVNNTDEFNGSRARNIGARHANGDVIAFFDADVTLPYGLVQRLIREMKWQGFQLICVADDKGNINGQCVVTRSAWKQVRGLDEGMRGWGYDDIDFYHRIGRANIPWGKMSGCRLSLIVHGDEESTRFHSEKDKALAAEANGARMQDFTRAINPDGYGDL